MKIADKRRAIFFAAVLVILAVAAAGGVWRLMNPVTEPTQASSSESGEPSVTTAETTATTTAGTSDTQTVASEPDLTSATTSPQTTTTLSPYLSVERIKGIAIAQVGGQARILSIHQETDDNPPVFELELQDDTYRYSLEIHAVTGAVLEFEREDHSEDDDDD